MKADDFSSQSAPHPKAIALEAAPDTSELSAGTKGLLAAVACSSALLLVTGLVFYRSGRVLDEGARPFLTGSHGGEWTSALALARGAFVAASALAAAMIATVFLLLRRHNRHRQHVTRELELNAYSDPLTGLPNRAAFRETLTRALVRTRRHPGRRFAVLILDLDRFKNINDTLTHDVGDRLLEAVAKRLLECLRPDDVAARLGGDEFTVLLDDLAHPEDAMRVAERIVEALAAPFSISQSTLPIHTGSSIGIALNSPDKDERPEDLLRDADAAMYRAKAAGKGRAEVFDPVERQRAVARLRLEADLRRAMLPDSRELSLHFQPIVSLTDNYLVAFEALARWNHPELGMVPPSEFIPIAEEAGLINTLGRWVLSEAATWLVSGDTTPDVFDETRKAPIGLNVNVSPRQLGQADWAEYVESVLKATGLAPKRLRLEVTESAVFEDTATAVRVLSRLRRLGVAVHVDDFGTGQSSLSRLTRLDVDALKIDRSFVAALGETGHDHGDDAEVVRMILALARALGLQVVAEGVETSGQREVLRALGCDFAQGYFFSPPVPSAAATELMHHPHMRN